MDLATERLLEAAQSGNVEQLQVLRSLPDVCSALEIGSREVATHMGEDVEDAGGSRSSKLRTQPRAVGSRCRSAVRWMLRTLP